MKLTVFQSEKGDCVLLEGREGGRVLADGGMSSTYTKHVAPFLGTLRKNNQPLDAVYLSHIDEDHIDGILQLMEDEVAWRTYLYQIDPNGGNNEKAKKPTSVRPPVVEKVWHNAFHDQVKDNKGEIEEMLAATATILTGSTNRDLSEIVQFHQNLAASVRQAINLSRRLGEKQLNIKLNPEAKGKLMMLRKVVGKPIKVGSMDWTIIGPMPVDLEILKRDWNKWLEANKKALVKIDTDAKKTAKNMGNGVSSSINAIVGVAAAQGELLGTDLIDRAGIMAESKKKVLGAREKVTAPNLASLMFLVEEPDTKGVVRTVLMTGDGHHIDIIKGLEATKHLKANDSLHVDVLKVQHHGAEFNIDEEFCKRVIADHYVFCGNGAHANPDLDVVRAIINSRISAADQGTHTRVNDPFKLWFNSNSSNVDAEAADNKHMKLVENLVATMSAGKTNRIKSFFLTKSNFEIDLS
jgi:beta-lactamase superfamily II metal-dependent hydrolase